MPYRFKRRVKCLTYGQEIFVHKGCRFLTHFLSTFSSFFREAKSDTPIIDLTAVVFCRSRRKHSNSAKRFEKVPKSPLCAFLKVDNDMLRRYLLS